jgi:hypothetical protein
LIGDPFAGDSLEAVLFGTMSVVQGPICCYYSSYQ